MTARKASVVWGSMRSVPAFAATQRVEYHADQLGRDGGVTYADEDVDDVAAHAPLSLMLIRGSMERKH